MKEVCGPGTSSSGNREEREVISAVGSFCRLIVSELEI